MAVKDKISRFFRKLLESKEFEKFLRTMMEDLLNGLFKKNKMKGELNGKRATENKKEYK